MPYGMIHAVFLPPTLEFNLVVCEDKAPTLAQSMGVMIQYKSLSELRKGIIERLDALLTDLGAPRKLIWKNLSADDIIENGLKIESAELKLSLDRTKQGAVIRKYGREDLMAILQKALP
jgi:alcohol dehydrogenase class IV